MAVNESFLPVGTSLKNLDTTVITQSDGSTEAHREAVFLADPANNEARLGVTLKDGVYTIAVQNTDTRRLVSLTEELIKKQDLTNRYLSLLTSANLGEQNDGT